MTTTAFQRNAFQFGAFQIDLADADTHDGADHHHKFYLPIYVGKGHRKQPLGNLIRIYNEAKEIEGTEKLLSIIEPFVEVQNKEELQKRSEAKLIVDTLPDIDRVRMDWLVQNQMAIDLLLDEMEIINERLNRQKMLNNEDDLLLILLCACI